MSFFPGTPCPESWVTRHSFTHTGLSCIHLIHFLVTGGISKGAGEKTGEPKKKKTRTNVMRKSFSYLFFPFIFFVYFLLQQLFMLIFLHSRSPSFPCILLYLLWEEKKITFPFPLSHFSLSPGFYLSKFIWCCAFISVSSYTQFLYSTSWMSPRAQDKILIIITTTHPPRHSQHQNWTRGWETRINKPFPYVCQPWRDNLILISK